MVQTFLNGKVILHPGDCLETVRALPENSIDAIVTDPPYALVSIAKRLSSPTAKPIVHGKDGAYARASAGFMGKKWDTGETAFAVEFWAETLRVLKPGGHMVAFGGTRSYHRLACAIEDAGFEIRDQLAWAYGSGFPKSHDVSKGIDKAAKAEREIVSSGAPVKRMIPGADQNKDGWEKNNGREFVPTVTRAATPEAAAWEGWGTALKPAWEPICLARKPLSEGTVAANVLRWGTGAINVDGCKIGTEKREYKGGMGRFNEAAQAQGYRPFVKGAPSQSTETFSAKGRWPANFVHDGSDEVIAAFPDSSGGHWSGETPSLVGAQRPNGAESFDLESGSAARFFYSAKADSDDRIGSKHPTVKPVDLMQWLCRLITPPGGTVLDPFAGTGTTGEAAWREGFKAILCEREAEYQADIVRRMEHALSGPDARRHTILKAKGKVESAGPLFD